MGVPTTANHRTTLETPKGSGMVVAGYCTAAGGLVAFLTINGASNTPALATIVTAGLIAFGLLLPAAGMLRMRRALGDTWKAARFGYPLQALGLCGLLFAVVLIQVAPTLSGYLVGMVLDVVTGVAATAGVILVQRGRIKLVSSNPNEFALMVLGTVMIFAGVGVIMGSNIAFEYLISSVENTIYVDVGATVSACGCVIAAYSFFLLQGRR